MLVLNPLKLQGSGNWGHLWVPWGPYGGSIAILPGGCVVPGWAGTVLHRWRWVRAQPKEAWLGHLRHIPIPPPFKCIWGIFVILCEEKGVIGSIAEIKVGVNLKFLS